MTDDTQRLDETGTVRLTRRALEEWRARPKGWDLSISVIREAAAQPVVVALNVRRRRRKRSPPDARPWLASLVDALEGGSVDGVIEAYDAACDTLGREHRELGTWLDVYS